MQSNVNAHKGDFYGQGSMGLDCIGSVFWKVVRIQTWIAKMGSLAKRNRYKLEMLSWNLEDVGR